MSIPFDLNSLVFLTQGSEGEIFTIPNQNDVVVKIMQKQFTRNSFYKIKKICNYLKENNIDEIVSIINYGSYKKNKQEYLWIMMEKLNPLSKNELKEFKILKDIYHTCFSLKQTGTEEEEISNKLNDWKKQLKNKKSKIFLDQILKLKIYHVDLFEENILKDSFGNYKIIDINDFEMVK